MPSSAPTFIAAGNPLSASAPGPATLDAATAIELLDNSTALYREIAQAYLQEIDALGQRVVDLLQQAKQQEATRTLHTFKGLSLTVGANLLSEVCRQCELQLKAVQRDNLALDDASCQHIKVGLDNAVAHTQLALRAVLAQLDEGRPVSVLVAPLDQTALVADLRVLQSMLTRSDLQALDRYAALSDSHPSLQNELQDLHQAIKIFDFPQAVVQCEKLIRTFSAPIRR